MSLAKILAARKRKRNFYDGGPDFADGSGSIDGGLGGNNVDPGGGGPEPGQAPGTVNPDAFTPPGGGPGPTYSEYRDPGPSTGVYGGSIQHNGETIPGGAQRTDIGKLIDQLGEMTASQRAGIAALPGAVLATIGLGLADKAGLGWTGGNNTGASRGASSGTEGGMGTGLGADAAANPFGSSTPTQTTPATPTDAGMRRYVWDPVARQYTLTNVGGGANPMGYTAGQTFRMAAGGAAPAGLAAARTQPRFVQGGGTGLSDDVPVKMDDGGDGRLADGEFVIPADVVSGLGGGSSKAGADMLYQMMERIRQAAHGKSQQIRPVDPGRVLPA